MSSVSTVWVSGFLQAWYSKTAMDWNWSANGVSQGNSGDTRSEQESEITSTTPTYRNTSSRIGSRGERGAVVVGRGGVHADVRLGRIQEESLELQCLGDREEIKRLTKRVSKKNLVKSRQSPLRRSSRKSTQGDRERIDKGWTGLKSPSWKKGRESLGTVGEEEKQSLRRAVDASLSDKERLREVDRQLERTAKLPASSAYARHKLNVLKKAKCLLEAR